MLQYWSQQFKGASQERLIQSPCSSRVPGQTAWDQCSDTPTGKRSLCPDGVPRASIYTRCLILSLGTTEKSAPFWSKESNFSKGLLSDKPSYQHLWLCVIVSGIYPCVQIDCLHDNRILQKFSLVPMSANDRHKQAAEQRTMHRRDVIEIKIPAHFPIGKLIICSHSTKIHRQGVQQPKKRLLIFVEGLHKLLLHCPILSQSEILMTTQFCH